MSEKRRILFVDDEQRILDGLRRMLHSMNREWKMVFAASGQEALSLMKEEPFDVVVTDMRMPGMSGAELLNEIRKRYPHTIRIVLSGQTKRETILRSITPIHQFLSKPSDKQTITSTLARALKLRELLTEKSVIQLVSQVESLPSLPAMYHKIVKVLQFEETSVGMVGDIISQDISMSAKMLQLVNSAFFGLARRVSNPTQAVVLLGLETVKSLVLSIHLFSQFDEMKLKRLSLDALWKHSLAVGGFAKRIAQSAGIDKHVIDDSFAAGLLHDVGKLVLASSFPDKYSLILKKAHEEKIQVYEAEYDMFRCSHAEVGAYLLGLWDLPDSLIMSCAFHHNLSKHPDKKMNIVAITHLADGFESELNPKRRASSLPVIDRNFFNEIGILERIPEWRLICQQSVSNGVAQ